MKPFVWLLILTQLTLPVLAQDPSDADSDFFNLDSLGEFGPLAPEFEPLVEVRRLLASANVASIDKTQENDLKKVYDKEVKPLEKPYEKRFGVPLKTAMGALQRPARGRRGGNSGRPESAQVAETRRLAEQLVDKMIAALRVDQQGALRRFQSEQIRISKLNTLIGSMTQAETPLTPEQRKEIEALLARESRLRALIIVEAKGQPYRSQIVQLEAQTTQRVMTVLDPPQRIAYAATTAPTGPTRNVPAGSRGRN
jgi:hypothetical protein